MLACTGSFFSTRPPASAMTQPPSSNTPPARHGSHHLPVPQRVPASRCFAWLASGWRMYAAHPVKWATLGFISFVTLVATSLLGTPILIIGPLLPLIVLSLLVGGLIQVAHIQQEHSDFELVRAFDGIRLHAAKLSLIGFLYAIPPILVYLTLIVLTFGGGLLVSLLGIHIGEALHQWLDVLMGLAVAMGVISLLYAILLLAFLFAPSLVMICETSSWDAMRLSLKASLKNIFGITSFAALLLSLICIPTLIPALEWQVPLFTNHPYVKLLIAFFTFLAGMSIYIPVAVGAIHSAFTELFPSSTPPNAGAEH